MKVSRALEIVSALVIISVIAVLLATAFPPRLEAYRVLEAKPTVVDIDMTDFEARQEALQLMAEAQGTSVADIEIQGGSPEIIFQDLFLTAPTDGKIPPGWGQAGSGVGNDNWDHTIADYDSPGSLMLLDSVSSKPDTLYHDVEVSEAKKNATQGAEVWVAIKAKVYSSSKGDIHTYFQTGTGDALDLGGFRTEDYVGSDWHWIILPRKDLGTYLARNEGRTRFFITATNRDGSYINIGHIYVMVLFKTYRWEIDQLVLRETDSPTYGQTIGRWWVEDAHGDSTRFWCDTGRCTMLVYAFRSLVGEGHPGDGYRVSEFSLPAMPPQENLELADYYQLPAIRLDEYNDPPDVSGLVAELKAQLATLPPDSVQVQDETDPRIYLPLVIKAPVPEWPKCVGNKCWDNQNQLIADLEKADKDEWLVANTINVDTSALDASGEPTREQLEQAISALESIGTQSSENLGPLYPLLANDDLYSWPDPSRWVAKVVGPITFARMLRFREDVNWAGTTIFFWPCVWWLGNLVDLATFIIHGVWYEGYHSVLFHVKQNIKQRMFMSEEELVEYYVEVAKQEWEWRNANIEIDGEEYTGLVAVTEVGLITYLIYVVVPKLSPQTAPLFLLEIHGFGGIGVEYTPPIPG